MGDVVARDPLIGRRLGEYLVRERIGEGGFGAVYRAQQEALSREAVIKVLRVGRSSDEATVRRFSAEAQVASRLDHPYAAHIYGFGAEADGTLWIAMELVRGAGLDVLLTVQGPIKLDRFVPFFERVCEVVHTAHEQGIVHRDLKPANIMVLTRAGRLLPKLLDLGIAKVLGAIAPEDGLAATVRASVEGLDLGRTAPMSTTADPPNLPRVVGVDGLTGNEILGSPRYMAPEQWDSPSSVDPRTDVYALGAVAFEALTGKPAFEDKSIMALMAAHAMRVPSLPAGFPAAINAVLERALAKKQADRFATALELAEAFRAAAGLRSERASLPQLDRKVRNRFVDRAPEPVADAIVALEQAENTHHARDAIGQVARATARWIGVLAVSCRSRAGSGETAENALVQQKLRSIRREGLTDREWLELARELVRPFDDKRDAHPIPELVAALLPREREPDAIALLTALLKDLTATDPGSTLRLRVIEMTRRLGEALNALAFVTDYDIVARSDGRVERYNGARRVPRATATAEVESDSTLLLDGEGSPVLILSPLVQAAPPSPGADRELFLLDGPGRGGARLVSSRQGFEIHDATLWDWFQSTLLTGETGDTPERIEERPYRGLSAFAPQDAHLFFGREREVDAFVNRLRVTPLLAVVGPSGAGKSSFVHAGVIPALNWRTITARPGASPLATLAAKVGRAELTALVIAERPEALGDALRALAARDGRVVLVIDQLEELFTLCADASEREAFARAISLAVRGPDDPIRVIVTLRDDFLMRAEALPVLRERLVAGLNLLGTPNRDDQVRILVEPARAAGYTFEDDRLAEEMVDAVADRPGALALLSFTAAALWELRDRHFRHLTRKSYVTIGGVGGALVKHAEETLTAMSPDQRALVREAFRRLVTAEGTRAVLTRRELAQVLGDTPKAESVIEVLVGARLLAASEAEDGEHVEVTHEALLSEWPRLVEWRREDAEGARLRDQLRAAARQWDERGRPSGLLWRGDALAEFQFWRARVAGKLTEVEDAFTGAALREAAGGKRRRTVVLVAAFAFLVVALAGTLWLNQRTKAARATAETERTNAVESLARLYEEQGRLQLLAGRPARALVYLVEARHAGAHGAALEIMIAAAARSVEAVRMTLRGHSGEVRALAVSHDGHHVLTGGKDGTARLWDVATGRLVATLTGHTDEVFRVAFAHDDAVIATAAVDGTVRLWDARGQLRNVITIGGPVLGLAFSPDGQRLATASGLDEGTGAAAIWTVSTGAPIAKLGVHAYINDIAWRGDGTEVVTSSDDNLAQVWNAATGALELTLTGHSNRILQASFNPDGTLIATASADGTGGIWERATGKRRATLVHADRLKSIEFSPDGQSLVTASVDRSAKLWDATTGKAIATLLGHDGPLLSASFSLHGDRVVTAGGDGAARIWDAKTGVLLAVRDGHAGIVAGAVFTPDGTQIATASWDGTAKLWDATPDFTIATATADDELGSMDIAADGRIAASTTAKTFVWKPSLGDPEVTIPTAKDVEKPERATTGFSPDGTRIVTAEKANVAQIWSASGALVLTLSGHGAAVTCARFSHDGQRVVTASKDGTVRIWDATSGAQQRVLTMPAGVEPTSVQLAPNDHEVIVAGGDGVIRMWTTDGAALPSFVGKDGWIGNVEMMADGRHLVTSHPSRAVMWDVASRAPSGVLDHSDTVFAARSSGDGSVIITASRDRTIRVWDMQHLRPILVLTGHGAGVTDVRFASPTQLVSTSLDHTIRQWRLARDTRSYTDLLRVTRCNVPYQLDSEGGIIPFKTRCDTD